MRISLRAAVLAAALGAWGCSAGPVVNECRDDGPVLLQSVDDRAVRRWLERRGAELCESGGAELCSALLEHPSAGGRAIELPAASAEAMALPALYAARAPGVLVVAEVYKCTRCPNWHVGGEGAGFVLTSDGVCVTNRHMFEGRRGGYLMAAGADGVVRAVTGVLASNEGDDVAVFTVEGEGLAAIPLQAGAAAGLDVAVISHPNQNHYTLTRGIVARRARRAHGINGKSEDLHALTEYLNVTAEYAVGSSGAPVLDLMGNAVGMVVSTQTIYADEEKKEHPQMVMRLCVPTEAILKTVGAARGAGGR